MTDVGNQAGISYHTQFICGEKGNVNSNQLRYWSETPSCGERLKCLLGMFETDRESNDRLGKYTSVQRSFLKLTERSPQGRKHGGRREGRRRSDWPHSFDSSPSILVRLMSQTPIPDTVTVSTAFLPVRTYACPITAILAHCTGPTNTPQLAGQPC
ncbi:hypothetical protein J6590_011556 [Homalodisca vitripennis]|nr:hypothetical protein J6590_011556 [Homalodisca vitripennis]